MAMFSRLTLIVPTALLLGACAVDPLTQSYDTGFGEAVKYDVAVQTIDPDPVYAPDDAKPGDNGDKGAQAVKRYRTGAVKDVEVMQTTGGSGGGGSSGGGPH
jgi:hypothetical protein